MLIISILSALRLIFLFYLKKMYYQFRSVTFNFKIPVVWCKHLDYRFILFLKICNDGILYMWYKNCSFIIFLLLLQEFYQYFNHIHKGKMFKFKYKTQFRKKIKKSRCLYLMLILPLQNFKNTTSNKKLVLYSAGMET